MKLLRAILVWVLVLSLPIEGMASMAMAHCQDHQARPATSSNSMPAGHDHAAMVAMASMGDADSIAHMHHAAPSTGDEPVKDFKASSADCQCGCDCSGNCAVACAGMMLSAAHVGLAFAIANVSVSVAMPQGQAHAAYRYDSLRPPSAVAL